MSVPHLDISMETDTEADDARSVERSNSENNGDLDG